jgi:hypothetical protein
MSPADANGGLGKFVPWPDWKIGDIPSLARYVSIPALDETGLPGTDRYTGADPGWKKGREIARVIYGDILGFGLKYMHEPWREETFGLQDWSPLQRVRYAAWVRRDSGGTCLDLAILYATALMRAQIRPYIAILYPAELADLVRGGFEGHAFVIADLRAPLTDQHLGLAVPSPLERPHPDAEQGLLVIRAGQELPPYLLAVDPTRATTNFPLGGGRTAATAESFADAESAAAGYLARTEARLCDVATAQVTGQPPLPRPADSSSPAIWTRLPEMPAVTHYPSRADDHERLARARGRIVIYGPQGFGKSTLAYVRARAADGGYGWFLNATDRSTLQSELARAENDQQERGFRQPLEKPDQVPFSELAVRRLEVSDAPWVLVLDNADDPPGDITPLLPRSIGPGQTIIVTTTKPEWLQEWPESAPGQPATTHIELTALGSEDMPALDAGVRDLVSGSALFYEAARAAMAAGACLPQAPESAAGLVWQLASDCLAGQAEPLDLAHLIAWAPPVALPLAGFAAFFPHLGAPDGLAGLGRSLERAGLVRFIAQRAPSVLMHRLIAARIRADERLIAAPGQERVPAPVALMATAAGQDLMTRFGDEKSFTRLEGELGAEWNPLIPARTWGLAVYGIARAGEIRGRSGSSSALFETAIGYLDERMDRSLLSECWNGRARQLKDHPPEDAQERARALDAALSWALTARDLAARAADDDPPASEQRLWDLIRAERAHAMQALIVRRQADAIADQAEKKSQLARAMAMLAESEASRSTYLAELGILDSPDIDRARFNLGGSGIGLAKLSRGAEAENYLRAARRAYADAKRIRVGRYGEGFALPAIAACDNGVALACYYGALLEADPLRDERQAYTPISPQTRMFLLRQATAACAEAFRARSLLAPADADDLDAIKSADLTIKIGQVRKLVSAFHARGSRPLSQAEAERMLGLVGAEAMREAGDLGQIIGSPPPAGPAAARSGQ